MVYTYFLSLLTPYVCHDKIGGRVYLKYLMPVLFLHFSLIIFLIFSKVNSVDDGIRGFVHLSVCTVIIF